MIFNRARLALNAPILVIELFTLLLLGYISYGEVNSQYLRFTLARMEAQAETIKAPLESYLQAALPLEQFGGFASQAVALVEADRDIQSIRIVEPDGRVLFRQPATAAPVPDFAPLAVNLALGGEVAFTESAGSYRASLALKGKFGAAGRIEIDTAKEAVSRVMDGAFLRVVLGALALGGLFAFFILAYDRLAEDRPALAARQTRVFAGAYLASFVLMTALIVATVLSIYDAGARSKAKALADAMAERLGALAELHIDLADVTGINDLFRDYQGRHADLGSIALVDGQGRILCHNEERQVGEAYRPPADSYGYSVPLPAADGSHQRLEVTIPATLVSAAILGQAKEFVALLVACGLISWVFLEGSCGLLARRKGEESPGPREDPIVLGLKLIKPAYFLIVFTSALPLSFLPQLARDMATGVSFASAMFPFTIYYLVFAAVLIPAGRFAEKGSLKAMMELGFVAELLGLLAIALGQGYWLLTLGRIFSGFGQGLFLIGLNSYTLSITPRDKRTLGNTVKVNGRNAALIAGTAIGALLYTYMDYRQVFLAASAISLAGMVYVARLVPGVEEIRRLAGLDRLPPAPDAAGSLVQDMVHVLRDPEFLRTLALVGISGKIAIAGVIMFATPLIMAAQGFSAGDIGLALMVFYIASIVVTRHVSPLVDQHQASRATLFLSTVIGGAGMLLMGISGIRSWDHGSPFPGLAAAGRWAADFNSWLGHATQADPGPLLLLAGIVLTGIANGLLSAPIMTHIDKTPVAHSRGNKAVAAVYLFLERSGHVLGPMVISALLATSYGTPLGIALFGAVTILLGALFLATSRIQ